MKCVDLSVKRTCVKQIIFLDSYITNMVYYDYDDSLRSIS
jgi:hypothetical protein